MPKYKLIAHFDVIGREFQDENGDTIYNMRNATDMEIFIKENIIPAYKHNQCNWDIDHHTVYGNCRFYKFADNVEEAI